MYPSSWQKGSPLTVPGQQANSSATRLVYWRESENMYGMNLFTVTIICDKSNSQLQLDNQALPSTLI